MTSIPVDRPSDNTDAAVVPLSTSRARAPGRAHAPARGGALEPVQGTAPPRFDRSAVLDLVQPPDIWSDARPSLRSRWLYARYGAWTGERTLGRTVGGVYAVLVGLPVAAALQLLDWIFERPTRLLIAVVLVALTVVSGIGPF